MPVEIPDLAITSKGVSATLSFARTPHSTVIPWSAVFALVCTDGRQMVFADDIPTDLGAAAARAGVVPETKPEAARGRAAVLHAVPLGDAAAEAAVAESDAGARPTRRKRPTLKLVK
jgi:hypothetical protein